MAILFMTDVSRSLCYFGRNHLCRTIGTFRVRPEAGVHARDLSGRNPAIDIETRLLLATGRIGKHDRNGDAGDSDCRIVPNRDNQITGPVRRTTARNVCAGVRRQLELHEPGGRCLPDFAA
jgi:hypothetical protein